MHESNKRGPDDPVGHFMELEVRIVIRALLLRFFAAGLAFLAVAASAAPSATALIPYEKFNLDNGLTVIVHTD